MAKTEPELKAQKVAFPNGNRARFLFPVPGSSPSEILKALDLEHPKAVLLLIGGAEKIDESLQSRLLQLCSRGVAKAAAEAGALIIDGGTASGIMAMIGQGVAERGHRSPLLGVAPEGAVFYPGKTVETDAPKLVPLDQNHSHFALADGSEWGSETDLMFMLAEHMSREAPVIAVLINGGAIARDEMLRCVRQCWPVLVVKGSGRLADDIADLCAARPDLIEDTALAEIVADGTLFFFPEDGTADQLEQKITRFLNTDSTLRLVWERFVIFDENSKLLQAEFRNIQIWILFLGVVATALAMMQAQLTRWDTSWWDNRPFRYAIVLMPIAVSVLVAISSRLKQGNKWVLLRAGAEAIKREIFRYRARSKEYGDGKLVPEAVLADCVEIITRRLMRTTVNMSALRPPKEGYPYHGNGGENNSFSLLNPGRYMALRLDDQLNYYQSKTVKLDNQLKYLCWLIYGFGGVGTFLAAVGAQLWVALTTALVGAFTTYLEYQQLENTLMKYNQAATDLANIKAWWSALSEEEREDSDNYSILVENTEKVLESELAGWVHRMEDALAKLKAEQEAAKASKEGREAPKMKRGEC